mgnify:CR=1 FL=1
MTVDTAATVLVTPTVIKFTTALTYEILQAAIPRLAIELPAAHTLTRLQGEQIRDWKIMPGTNNTAQFMSFERTNSGTRVDWWRAEGIPIDDTTWGNLVTCAREMNVGFGPTKTLAKLANHEAVFGRDREIRQMIDILAMLELKTRGNLTAQERTLLEQVLYELRLRFVSA